MEGFFIFSMWFINDFIDQVGTFGRKLLYRNGHDADREFSKYALYDNMFIHSGLIELYVNLVCRMRVLVKRNGQFSIFMVLIFYIKRQRRYIISPERKFQQLISLLYLRLISMRNHALLALILENMLMGILPYHIIC